MKFDLFDRVLAARTSKASLFAHPLAAHGERATRAESSLHKFPFNFPFAVIPATTPDDTRPSNPPRKQPLKNPLLLDLMTSKTVP